MYWNVLKRLVLMDNQRYCLSHNVLKCILHFKFMHITHFFCFRNTSHVKLDNAALFVLLYLFIFFLAIILHFCTCKTDLLVIWIHQYNTYEIRVHTQSTHISTSTSSASISTSPYLHAGFCCLKHLLVCDQPGLVSIQNVKPNSNSECCSLRIWFGISVYFLNSNGIDPNSDSNWL